MCSSPANCTCKPKYPLSCRGVEVLHTIDGIFRIAEATRTNFFCKSSTSISTTSTIHFVHNVRNRAACDELKKQGILVGAHIPMGPSALSYAREMLNAFNGFSDSMLDAAELARANKDAGLRASGNLPWDRFVNPTTMRLLLIENHPIPRSRGCTTSACLDTHTKLHIFWLHRKTGTATRPWSANMLISRA